MAKDFSADQLQEWEQSVSDLRHHGIACDPADEPEADHGAAMLMSGWGGWMDMPTPIAGLVNRAIEAGYLQALTDVRDGKIDGLGPLDG
jgi:hypothetical protein